LKMSLALANDNARALYYMALVERRSGNSDAEIADLKKVVAQYPMSRDARRELGKSYYRQNNTEGAVEQFEALQQLDPDDVTAHYNLAILYGRMGKDRESAEQQAMFKTKKVDPGAPTYSFDFLMKHPEISTESVPWHMHTDLSPEFNATAPKANPPAVPAATPTPSGSGGANR
jgi:tetratricopeptide (TPR) repeat protein